MTTTRTLIPVRINTAMIRLVNAPGFTADTFTRSLHKARTVKAGSFRSTPIGNGRVLVNAGSHAEYVVTRTSCQCDGHRLGGGYCYHRAGVLWCDAIGIDVCRETVLGFGADGSVVTQADRDRELAA
jgi:hypothetical protein